MEDRARDEKAGARPHVVILGAGFGGLAAARALARERVKVTIVDKRNHHLFQPLLYQVATAALAAPDIASPIRKVLSRQKNATVLMGRAAVIDHAHKVLRLVEGEVAYDYLVVATGMTNHYFGHPEWEQSAPGLKSLEDALEIRRRVLLAYEAAEAETDPEARREHLTFVLIGGGATGVELAGALVEIAQRTMTRNFRNFDPGEARVILLEGGPRLVPAFAEDLGQNALESLQKLGVEVRLGTRVTGIDDRGVLIGDERIRARTVLWGAGVGGVEVVKTLGVALDRAGRVPVEPDLRVKGVEGVFVIGDAAALEAKGALLPGVAQVAIQQGRHAAKNILRAIDGEPLLPFAFFDKGSMATIGRSRAIAEVGKLHITGFLAWAAWLLVHVILLIDFRNRLVVLLNWTWAYVTFQRSARIILEAPVARAPEPPAPALAPGRPAPGAPALLAAPLAPAEASSPSSSSAAPSPLPVS